MHQGAFARARDAGDRNQHSQRNRDIHVLQIVSAGIAQAQQALARSAPLLRNLNLQIAAQVAPG